MKTYEMGAVVSYMADRSLTLLFTRPGVMKRIVEEIEKSEVNQSFDVGPVDTASRIGVLQFADAFYHYLPFVEWLIYGILCDNGYEPYAHDSCACEDGYSGTHYFRREHEDEAGCDASW